MTIQINRNPNQFFVRRVVEYEQLDIFTQRSDVRTRLQ